MTFRKQNLKYNITYIVHFLRKSDIILYFSHLYLPVVRNAERSCKNALIVQLHILKRAENNSFEARFSSIFSTTQKFHYFWQSLFANISEQRKNLGLVFITHQIHSQLIA